MIRKKSEETEDDGKVRKKKSLYDLVADEIYENIHKPSQKIDNKNYENFFQTSDISNESENDLKNSDQVDCLLVTFDRETYKKSSHKKNSLENINFAS